MQSSSGASSVKKLFSLQNPPLEILHSDLESERLLFVASSSSCSLDDNLIVLGRDTFKNLIVEKS